VEGRFVPQGGGFTLEILIGKRWVKVPRDRISRSHLRMVLVQRPGPIYDRNEARLIIRCVIIGGFA
jgi:hypothetical protein